MKGTCRDDVFKYISDIHLVNICKKRYNTIIGKLLQEQLICKLTYAKKEILNIANNMQHYQSRSLVQKTEMQLERRHASY